jgi:hypothetical protein
VPKDGKVCFWLDKTQFAEFKNLFTYTVVNAMNTVGDVQMVMVINYDVQACPGIPDLGVLGFLVVLVSPKVSIMLNNLQIKFKVTMAYVCNHTSWCTFLICPHCHCCHPRLNAHPTALVLLFDTVINFFDFNSAAGGDSASGLGCMCSNHASTTFSGIDFSQWYHSTCGHHALLGAKLWHYVAQVAFAATSHV